MTNPESDHAVLAQFIGHGGKTNGGDQEVLMIFIKENEGMWPFGVSSRLTLHERILESVLSNSYKFIVTHAFFQNQFV